MSRAGEEVQRRVREVVLDREMGRYAPEFGPPRQRQGPRAVPRVDDGGTTD